MCYSWAFCWGVLSAVSSCRTPFLKNFWQIPWDALHQLEPRAIMGSCWNFLLCRVPSTHEMQKYVSRRIADDQIINQFFSDNFRRFRLSRWPYFPSQLHWLDHYQSDSANCTTLTLSGNRHVWFQYFTPSLTELCHLSTFAVFHTLNRFYDRHLVCSF